MGANSFLFNTKGVELYHLPSFISEEDCAKLYKLLSNPKAQFVHEDSKAIHKIEQQIAAELGCTCTQGEPFKLEKITPNHALTEHTDYFTTHELAEQHHWGGQRIWTVAIFLKDMERGGRIEFSEIGRSFTATKGTALIWKNVDDSGAVNPATLHRFLPSPNETLSIAIKYFREADVNNYEVPSLTYVEQLPVVQYQHWENVPRFTQTGFLKMAIPGELYQRICAFYYRGIKKQTASFVRMHELGQQPIYPSSGTMIWLDTALQQYVSAFLQPTVEEWIKQRVTPTFCYGLRTCKEGSKSLIHRDGHQTRVISILLCIDQRLNAPWPFTISNADDREYTLFIAPKEMLLYEGARLLHGRPKALDGDYYTYLTAHYINLP